ncbi:hypothetical protein ACWCQW_02845 [Streptomyces mirabilis]
MSARRQIIAALSEDSLGGIATMEDVAHAEQLVDAHRTEVLGEGATELDRIADETEARVAEHYGAASGIGPGSAEMVREAARTLRSLAEEKASAPAPTATPASPVFDPLPSYLHSIGHAGSETEQGLYAAYRQAIAEVARLQAETGADQPTAGEATPDFFQPGHTYTDGNGFRAPELVNYFRVEHVTRHPDRGHLRAIGWLRSGAPGAGWHGDFRDDDEFDGWTDVTETGGRS